MNFYTTESLGKRTQYTPEGFLVCLDVPIGRTGMMLYGPGETPVEVGSDGVARIERDADELFKPETIASFNGKPVTNDHPTVGVTIDNWRDLAMGYVVNPRRGSGVEDDLMLADLVLTDKGVIEEYLAGKKEVSSGYDNDYFQTAPGRGRQVNIIGNHVALVQRGRCGSRCSIRDHATLTNDCGCKGDNSMPVLFKEFKTKVIEAFKNSKNVKDLDNALDELGTAARSKTNDEEGIHIHAGGKYDDETLDGKFKTHDDALEDHEKRIGTLESGDKKTKDAAFDNAVKAGVAKALDALGLTGDRIKTLIKTADKTKDAECPECGGTGEKDGEKCPKCKGTGTIDKAHDAEEESDEEKERKKKEAAADQALDAEIEKEEPQAKGAKDSAYFADNFQATVAMAEIISPGIHLPTFDHAAKPGDTFTQICGLRRKALQLASKDTEMAAVIKKANGDKVLDEKGLRTASCDQIRTLFTAVGEFKKLTNNNGALDGVRLATAGGGGTGVTKSIAEVNKANRSRRW